VDDVGDVSLLGVVEMLDVLMRVLLVTLMSLVDSPGGAVDGRVKLVVALVVTARVPSTVVSAVVLLSNAVDSTVQINQRLTRSARLSNFCILLTFVFGLDEP